jgi:hypothetical protein
MSLQHRMLLIVAAIAALESSAAANAPTELYGVFEGQVANQKAYTNPFDFRVIELKSEFTAPSGKKISFFGFHDGDGEGGQTGNVWKFRCMPDEVGTWQYTYSWSDGTAGGKGAFEVEDTGLPGPLIVATDNPWYFMTSRGKPFHARPYGLHHYLIWSQTHRLSTELAAFKQTLQTKVVDRGYNMVMWPDMGDREQVGQSAAPPSGQTTDSWWLNTTDTQTFSIAAFRANEDALAFCRERGVYAFTFAGMVNQGSEYAFEDFELFLRYYLARMAPYCNYFGWSPVWEWKDIWTPDEVSQVMQYMHDHDPWQRLLTAHDSRCGRRRRRTSSRQTRAGPASSRLRTRGAAAAESAIHSSIARSSVRRTSGNRPRRTNSASGRCRATASRPCDRRGEH